MRRIGDFIINVEIDKTAGFAVYRGRHRLEEYPVIIKVCPLQDSSTTEVEKLLQEYAIIKNFDMNGIVNVYDQILNNKEIAIILEDVDAVTLKDMIISVKFDVNTFLNMAIKLSETLGSLHKENIVHYGLSSHTILIGPDSQDIKITDIGISKLHTQINETISDREKIEILKYVSPEQTGRLNCSVDYRTDLYSLGISFYEMVTGKVPFESNDPMEIMHAHIARVPVPPNELNDSLPSILSKIILKLISKTAEDRYQNAFGLMADLINCKEQLAASHRIRDFNLGKRDVSLHFNMPQRLFGREKAKKVLLRSFKRVASQGTSEILFVSGQPGIGKSALINAIYKEIITLKGYFIIGKYDQYIPDVPYSSIIQAFQRLVKQILSESEESVSIWKKRLLKALGRNGRIICEVIPEVELIVGSQPDVPDINPEEAQNRFKLVFKNFIRVIGGKGHPLVIFLDDLQWADMASLRLLKSLFDDKDNEHLLFIGAYRDNEVDESHFLTAVMSELTKIDVSINRISLGPLKPGDVDHLITDFLKCDPKDALELSELVHQKTSGNPFFIKQFLKSLYDKKALELNPYDGWKWDIDGIRKLRVTDNVVELMTEKIGGLTSTAQEIIKTAACMGSCFELKTISAISEVPIKMLVKSISEAMDMGLIYCYEDKYHFIHDRVQEAAYLLVAESDRGELHYLIGNYYLNQIKKEDLSNNIFEVVNQLNLGIDLITTDIERINLAELNYMAWKKAKKSVAYQSAINYIKTGRDLLDSNSWQDQYELTLAIYTESVEAEFLITNFDEMERLAHYVLSHTTNVLDQVKVYEFHIQALTARHKLIDAIDLTYKVLSLLGIELPRKITYEAMMDIWQTTMVMTEISDKEILDFAEMRDPYALAAIRISTSAASTFYNTGKGDVAFFLICKMVLLSHKYGNSPLTAIWLANFGLLFISFNDIDNGYRFGNLAMVLIEKFNARDIKFKVIDIVNLFINHWKKPLKETIPFFLEGYQMGMENGDLEYVSLNVFFCFSLTPFFCGKELADLEKDMTFSGNKISRLKHISAKQYNQMYHQTVLNLLGKSENKTSLTGATYNAEKMRPIHEKADDRFGLFSSYLLELILCYIFEDNNVAREKAQMAKQFEDAAPGLYPFASFHFYHTLNRLALLRATTSSQKKKKQLEKVIDNQEKLKLWANHAPENHLHKYHLVEAEIARVQGKTLAADKLYQKAITGAHENGFIQEEAIANELASRCWQQAGKTNTEELYISKAYTCYRLWGAQAKLKALELKYVHLRKAIPPKGSTVDALPVSGTVFDTFDAIDLSAVMKSSQALSREIDLDKLLERIMMIAIENAGAQKALLIWRNRKDKCLYIEASAEIEQGIKVLESIPFEKSDKLSTGIVNYVVKTGENVVLDNACSEGIFINDPYVIKNKPKSVVCAPLRTQKSLSAFIYVENNLSTHAFPVERLEIIKILSSQGAISLENAMLYKNLQERTKELKKANKKLKKQSKDLEETNIALRVLLQNQDDSQKKAEKKILVNVKHSILPILKRMKSDPLASSKENHIDIIESNLNNIIETFNVDIKLKYYNLTPTEIQIANLIRGRKSSKEIADYLNLSAGTVQWHRDNIRIKLGIKNKKVNLRHHLSDMEKQ